MHEKLGESLSALMDGEAGEADIQRVLDSVEDPALRETWRRYHAARNSLRSHAGVDDMDLSDRIMAAVNAEPGRESDTTGELGEALSALIDGEANDGDLERVLDSVENPALRESWRRYHAVRGSLQSQGGLLDLDLSGRIMAAIDAEPAHTDITAAPIDELGESLSALMDGEAGESDIQRVLDNVDNPAVRDAWQRYHVASASLQAQDGISGIDLSKRIMAAIDQDSDSAVSDEVEPAAIVEQIHSVGRFQRFMQPVASFAVAASVTAAVLLGGQYYGLLGTAGEVQPAPEAIAERGSPVTLLGGTATLAGYGYATPAQPQAEAPSKPEAAATDYDAIARERLRRYMLPHAGEAALNAPQGMMPYAKVATFKTEE